MLRWDMGDGGWLGGRGLTAKNAGQTHGRATAFDKRRPCYQNRPPAHVRPMQNVG